MMTDKERIEMMQRAMKMLDNAGILLVEATRHHYQASYKANPNALLDKNGNEIEIDLDDLGGKPICVELMMVGRRARQDAAKIKQALPIEELDIDEHAPKVAQRMASVVKRTISKEEAAPLLAKDRAAYNARKSKSPGVAPNSNVAVPGGKYDNPVVK